MYNGYLVWGEKGHFSKWRMQVPTPHIIFLNEELKSGNREMKIYTKGMIGKKYKINYKQIDQWRLKLRDEWGIFPRNGGWVKIPNDPYGRSGLPDYVVDAYPNVHPQPVIYIIQSARPEDVSFFIQQANLKLQLEITKVGPTNMRKNLKKVWNYLESGKSIAVDANDLIELQKRDIILGAIERGARELVVHIRGHWEPEPYNTIEYDTAGNDELFFEELKKKIRSLVI